MQPRLNVKVAELFEAFAENPAQQTAVGVPDLKGVQWPGDFMDQESDHTPLFKQIEDSFRSDWANQIDRDNQQGQAHGQDVNTASDPVPMAMNPALVNTPDLTTVPANAKPQLNFAASKLEQEARGFNNAQPREEFTMGVVASVNSGSLVQSRVVVETPNTKIAGTVIAVGDAEFAVVWDDRTASVERKADYELVVTE